MGPEKLIEARSLANYTLTKYSTVAVGAEVVTVEDKPSTRLARALAQPATRYGVRLDTHTTWITCSPRAQLPCSSCRRYRWASKLVAHSYYDGTWFYCSDAKKCRGERISKRECRRREARRGRRS